MRFPLFAICAVMLACSPLAASLLDRDGPRRRPAAPAPDLNAWLKAHPRIAGSIRWQDEAASDAAEARKKTVAWAFWNEKQKRNLDDAYRKASAWLEGDRQGLIVSPITDRPVNLHAGKNRDAAAARQSVSRDYMWRLYIAYVSFSLALEISSSLGWTLEDYDDESLRSLFDSTAIARNVRGGLFSMGTREDDVPLKRSDNLPRTTFAPPGWSYRFLESRGLIGRSRIETIGNLLEWMRGNLTHFFGNNSYGAYYSVWQYRGYPPLSKIVNGTVDPNRPDLGTRSWISGCHRSVGLLHEVLRAINIPVQAVWVCGHELAYFASERMYLDHGDDPYNGNVVDSLSPALSLLIDEPTYQAWFTPDLSANITDHAGSACRNVGRRSSEMRRQHVPQWSLYAGEQPRTER